MSDTIKAVMIDATQWNQVQHIRRARGVHTTSMMIEMLIQEATERMIDDGKLPMSALLPGEESK